MTPSGSGKDENAAVFSASNENAGPTPTGSESAPSQTKAGTRSSPPRKAPPSTSTAQSKPAGSANTNEQTNGSKPSKKRPSESELSSGTWVAMTPAEEKMYKRLASRHRLIRLYGAEAIVKIQEEENLKAKRHEWVTRHNLACFKCGTRLADEWVAGGRRKNGSLWVACKCIWRKGGESGLTP